jgi:adenylate cyclase
MSASWRIRIYENQQLVYSHEVAGPLELGRQCDDDPAPYTQKETQGRCRLVIASAEEGFVSRKHALLEPLPSGRVRLTNLSTKVAIGLPQGANLGPAREQEITLPAELTLGQKKVCVEETSVLEPPLQVLPDATMRPGQSLSGVPRLSALTRTAQKSGGLEVASLGRWLQATMAVLQSATNSTEFFNKAAQAVVDLVGLDSGRVLLLDKDEWKAAAVKTAPRVVIRPGWEPSRRVLQRVRAEKRTFWQASQQAGMETASLAAVQQVVAAPILDRHGEVIGALYGDRRHGTLSGLGHPISEVEALLVELVAGGVAAGLARLEQEQAALAARIQFEQFFTPKLAQRLTAQPELLQGRDSEVTVLFGDIRGFSRISERLGPARTVEWISDVLGALSECVLAHEGVVVEYIGDELMAMWGAPDEQPDHARLACRAALAMVDLLPQLNERWRPILQEPLAIGIGVNTGVAHVGNTGTRRKFRYGPLGNPVNLAGRVQGATKYLRVHLLLTGSTKDQLDDTFRTRRLCRVRVVNIGQPVDLFELTAGADPAWPKLQQAYEQALAEFEQRDFRKAARILGNLLAEYPEDGPSLILMHRAISSLVDGTAAFDPVWELPGK